MAISIASFFVRFFLLLLLLMLLLLVLLLGIEIYGLVILVLLVAVVQADAALWVEEVGITEITRAVTRVKLRGPQGGPVIGVEGERRIFMQI
jgi:hypothetical protein